MEHEMKAKIYLLSLLMLGVTLAGCSNSTAPTAKPDEKKKTDKAKPEAHSHGDAPHGGTIIELGKYHGELVIDHSKKQATLYILSEDLKKSEAILTAKFEMSVKNPPFQMNLLASRMETDPPNRWSRFVGTHENLAKEMEFEGTISGVIDDKPYFGEFLHEKHDDKKPTDAHGRPVTQVPADKEAELYQTPGGIYTAADVKANGNTTVTAKFKDLKIAHDLKPKTGDKLCPVTLTKANPELTWIIGGKKYEFCCPPCVEEFVTLAKTKPDEIKAPETYIKK
jgi:hypothetical protein